MNIRQSKLRVLAVAACFLVGCQSTEKEIVTVNTSTHFLDTEFPDFEQTHIPSMEEIFHVSPSMQKFIQEDLRTIDDKKERARTLSRKVLLSNDGKLLYDNSANFSASRTFEERSANCLSLTILTYALADGAGIRTHFQEIEIPEFWVHRQGLNLLNGHVNLAMYIPAAPEDIMKRATKLEVDFDPDSDRRELAKRRISKKRIVSMFYNNLGAESLVNKDTGAAYAYFRASIQMDPTFQDVWGNLGLLYRQSNHYEAAEKTYEIALRIDEDNLNIWNNYSLLMRYDGNTAAADQISNRISNKRNRNPYYHLLLGNEAYARGDWQEAIIHFKDGVKIKGDGHRFYFGLAKSYYNLGNIDKSTRYMKLAERHAKFNDDEDKYAEKLEFLRRF